MGKSGEMKPSGIKECNEVLMSSKKSTKGTSNSTIQMSKRNEELNEKK